MEAIALEDSPCDQHCVHSVSTSPHDAEQKGRTLLNVSSSVCAEACGPSFVVKASWISVSVTSDFEVVVQVKQRTTDTNCTALCSQLAACHGVTVKKSAPHFASISCPNVQELHGAPCDMFSLPMTADRVIAKDVSTCSTIAYSLPVRSMKAADRAREQPRAYAGAANCCGDAPVASKQVHGTHSTWMTHAHEEHANSSSPFPSVPRELVTDRETSHSVKDIAAYQAAAAARELPTIALLLRSALGNGHALIVLRPAVRHRLHKYFLEYTASLWSVSENVRRVAISPNGDGVFALCDRFAQMPLLTEATTSGADEETEGETHLWLRGSYVHMAEGRETCWMLKRLLLHIGLRGSLASRRRPLCSLLRSAVSGVWCRWGLRLAQHVHAHKELHAGVTEVSMSTTEGHVLVFQPVLHGVGLSVSFPDEGSNVPLASSTAAHDSVSLQRREPVVYTCCYGTRLSYSLLSGSTSSNTARSATRRAHSSMSLCIAPPWSFAAQWRHSTWLRKALEAAGDNATEEAYSEHPRPHHHRPPAVLATSPNRRVWLIRAGAHLSVVTVPSAEVKEGAEQNSALSSCTAAAVKVGSGYTLHDAQFVQSGDHGGFLLLCRCRGGDGRRGADGAAECMDGDGAVLAEASTHVAVQGRYVHGSPASPLRVFFLSLLAMCPPGAGACAHDTLLPLPLRLSSRLASQTSSLLHPSHRLRFVCAADGGPTEALSGCSGLLYLVIASSGSPRRMLTAAAHVPSLSAWCRTHLLHQLGTAVRDDCCLGGPPRSSLLSARVRQWVMHALSAALPSAALTLGETRVDAMAEEPHGPLSLPACSSFTPGSLLPPAADPLEVSVEVALLHFNYPQSECFHRFRDALSTFKDVLYFTLNAFVSVSAAQVDDAAADIAGEGVACVTAVFAGFCAVLRRSGLLDCVANNKSSSRRGGDGVGPLPATTSVLVLLHISAQLLKNALEDLCTAGHLSALLACASHLKQTVQPPLSHVADEGDVPGGASRCTPSTVWRLLLQPLFDCVWGVAQDYGLAADVTGDLLLYCSPAVRAMAKTGLSWFAADQQPKSQPTITPGSVIALTKEESARSAVAASSMAGPPLAATTIASAAQAVPSASPATAPENAATLATTYTSAELYEMVRRVFLLHGAAAALQLVHQLRQNDSTRDGVTEMAELYGAVQQRLDAVYT
ncbi:hypothetical protein ABL78_5892 [Leptomonas seymouri]|uniref:Uncharacterized protein n=1 Tax=Leptomonas seymouri TaxID=5684 RepID=A0A0N1PAP0_LEPSE|nr:hypothetical protein ABL78_5892 [Leptomonas seymouri]|eukprot:KPI85054.1 hypothetical protein ABL78_5892 [Leptomonas seymouri]